MNHNYTDSYRETARIQYNELRKLEQTFDFSVSDCSVIRSVLNADNSSFKVEIEPDDMEFGRCWFLLRQGNGEVPEILKELVIAFLSCSGKVISTLRTDRRGRAWCKLESGKYSLRFVDDVRSACDVEILLQLGDHLAFVHLDAVAECDDTPVALRDYIYTRRETPKSRIACHGDKHFDVEQFDLSMFTHDARGSDPLMLAAMINHFMVEMDDTKSVAECLTLQVPMRTDIPEVPSPPASIQFERALRPLVKALVNSHILSAEAKLKVLHKYRDQCITFMIGADSIQIFNRISNVLDALRKKSNSSTIRGIELRKQKLLEDCESGVFKYRLCARKYLAYRFALFCVQNELLNPISHLAALNELTLPIMQEFVNAFLIKAFTIPAEFEMQEHLSRIIFIADASAA